MAPSLNGILMVGLDEGIAASTMVRWPFQPVGAQLRLGEG